MTHFGFHLKPKIAGGGGTANIAFVNAGTQADLGTGGGSTISPVLPASRVNGNVLIAFFAVKLSVTGGTQTLSGTGWQEIARTGTGAKFGLWAFYVVDGNEGQPTLSWTNGTNFAAARIYQYSGTASSPIGAVQHNDSIGSPLTCSAITTTGNKSWAASFEAILTTSTTITTSSGFTQDVDTGTIECHSKASHKAIATSGTSSGAISSTFTGLAQHWVTALIELLAA